MTDHTAEQELLFFNGIDGESGEYALPPMTGQELSDFIQGTKPPENLNELKFRYRQSTQKTFGVREGVDPKKLDEAGWGVIFSHDADPAIKEALMELIDLRREQAGKFFKLYDGADGYRPDESKTDFLTRNGAGPGPADPEKVPYYLLIVGGPDEIPYQFQTQLDVQYAVGRIQFDSPGDYANYAQSVVLSETKGLKLPRQASFFGVANPGDQATKLSTDMLVEPLHARFKSILTDWEVNAFLREGATKAQLAQLLGGGQTPAFLFTGSHGMSFPLGSARQVPHQGALLCQDYPGPSAWSGKGAIPQDFYLAGDDLTADGGVLGLIAFFFACYGAGTPLNDEFSKQAFKQRTAIAAQPFLAHLPKNLLSHPHGGALAIVGHIERAWGYSFLWPQAGAQTTVFESMLRRLFDGHPVGSALEYFNERYAELSTVLSDELEEVEFGKKADPYELAGMWTANNDARGYTIIGDPAVRLPIAQAGETATQRAQIADIFSPAKGTPQSPPDENGQKEAAESPQADATVSESPSAQSPGGAQPAQALSENSEINFGLIDSLSETRVRLTGAVQQFAENLGQALAKAVDDATTLQVSTYVSDDKTLELGDNFPGNARLRAYTRIKIDGDVQVLVPADAGEIDRDLWSIHLDMVQQAQANRAEMIKATASAATGLLQALKVL
jgi:hypothetical protein